MYEKLYYAQMCIRNSQLKGLGGHLKKEVKVPLTVEQKFIYFGTNRQEPQPRQRWYIATANSRKTTPTNISDIWNKRPPEIETNAPLRKFYFKTSTHQRHQTHLNLVEPAD